MSEDDWTPSDLAASTVLRLDSSAAVPISGVMCSRCTRGMERGPDGYGTENWFCTCGMQSVFVHRN